MTIRDTHGYPQGRSRWLAWHQEHLMHEHTMDLRTSLGPVTAEFSTGRLTGLPVATVRTGPGFGINHHEYSGTISLHSPGWTEASAHLLHDTTFADADGKHPFPADRAAMVAAIRVAVAAYSAHGVATGSPARAIAAD